MLKKQVFFDNRALFNHRLGGAAVFDQDATCDRDVALESYITFDFHCLTVDQRWYAGLEARVEKIDFSVVFGVEVDREGVGASFFLPLGVDHQAAV